MNIFNKKAKKNIKPKNNTNISEPKKNTNISLSKEKNKSNWFKTIIKNKKNEIDSIIEKYNITKPIIVLKITKDNFFKKILTYTFFLCFFIFIIMLIIFFVNFLKILTPLQIVNTLNHNLNNKHWKFNDRNIAILPFDNKIPNLNSINKKSSYVYDEKIAGNNSTIIIITFSVQPESTDNLYFQNILLTNLYNYNNGFPGSIHSWNINSKKTISILSKFNIFPY